MSQLKFRRFKAVIKSWQTVLEEAAEFASSVGRERVVSISHSEDHSMSIVVVWYWDE